MKLLNKILTLISISLFSIYSYSNVVVNDQQNKPIISKIYIKGLKNIKLNTIISILQSKENELYSIDKIRNDIRSIMNLGYFDNIDYDYNNNCELIFIVRERPCIEQIIFNGNKVFSTKKLNKIIKQQKWHHYTTSIIQKGKKSLHKLYSNAGYHNCQISHRTIVNEHTNKVTIIFNIIENNKIIVKDIEITGLLLMNKKTIIKQLQTKIGYKFNNKIYIKDLEKLQAFYQYNGFIDYKLLDNKLIYNTDKTEVLINLNISEGKKYKLGNVTFNGNVNLNDKKLYKVSKLHYNDVMNQNKIINDVPKKIYAIYCDIGYINATIKPLLDKKENEGIVNITYLITENVKVYIGNVYVYHNNVRKAKILRREITLKSGEILFKNKLERSILNLYKLGFIHYVNYTLLPTEIPNVFDIVFSVVENKPGNINFIAGYSLLENITYGVAIQHTNMLNLGHTLTLIDTFSSRGYNYDITWIKPWLFNRNISLSINPFNIKKNINNLTVDIPNGYKEEKEGIIIGLNSRLSDYINIFIGYKFENIHPSSISKKDLSIVSNTQNKLLSIYVSPFHITSVITNLVYDSIDFAYAPSKGSIHSLSIQLANNNLGGNINFIKEIFTSTWYYTTLYNCIFSFRIECGAITTYGSTKILPLSELFSLGGATNVRGYGSDNSNIMGKYKCIMNIENTFPILLRHNVNILQGIVFFDIGGIWKNKRDINLNIGSNKHKLHSSVGLGMKLVSPLLPIKIYFAHGLNFNKYTEKQKIYVDIGRFTF